MLSFLNIGSGSKGNATIIYDENTTLLLDFGLPKKRICAGLGEIGRDFADIDALFITHDHSDHIACARMFPLGKPVYGGGDVHERITEALLPFDMVRVGSIDVTAVPLSHDAHTPLGYVFESGATKIVYVTDTGTLGSKCLALLKDADYYLFESNHDLEMLMTSNRPPFLKKRIAGKKGHLSNEQSTHYLSCLIGENTKAVYLAHLSQECNTPEKALGECVPQIGREGLLIACLSQDELTRGGDSDED